MECEALPGLHCEVKLGKTVSLWAALRQADDDCGERLPWVLARLDYGEWVVVVRLAHLRDLARKLWPTEWRT